jgi:hypothetical protein
LKLALLRLSRFKSLALLDTQGLELLVALHPRVWWVLRRFDHSAIYLLIAGTARA